MLSVRCRSVVSSIAPRWLTDSHCHCTWDRETFRVVLSLKVMMRSTGWSNRYSTRQMNEMKLIMSVICQFITPWFHEAEKLKPFASMDADHREQYWTPFPMWGHRHKLSNRFYNLYNLHVRSWMNRLSLSCRIFSSRECPKTCFWRLEGVKAIVSH